MIESKVFYFEGDDPEMLEAYEKARATFRYFWRELTWEYRRIVPALDLSAVKAVFSDTKPGKTSVKKPHVEQMWISDVLFDGKSISGRLINSPNHLKSVKEGDQVSRTLDEITDWIYAVNDVAYGGFTVAVMRLRMSTQQRHDHDAAWGLKFPGPKETRIVPADIPIEGEHPMSEGMAEAVAREFQKMSAQDYFSPTQNGWTTLHSMCLGGSYATAKVLLEHGADPNEKTGNGLTALELARTLGWERVSSLLLSHGAK